MSHAHPKDPLHGLTLEMIVVALVDFYGWEELGRMVVIRCFNHDPSVKSSLTFLRRTPWARAKVEEMYLWMKIEAADRADEARAREALAAESGDRAPAGEATNHACTAVSDPDLLVARPSRSGLFSLPERDALATY